MSIGIVKIAFFLRVSNGKVRVSFRSKEKIDVSEVAKRFDGGGHLNAAGFSIETLDLDEAKEVVLKEILETTKE
ncbi:MAG: DHH family phosphoesterase [Halarcobacter sp.]